MINKQKLILYIIFSISLYCQDISIFFLKDGSIVQGKIVNENQSRIFLKTEQGTIKIYPSDVIGREDKAKQGELTYFSERIEYLQNNVTQLGGQVNKWNDSLRIALEDLYELYRNLEVLQNEFEIDLLRIHSQGREFKKNIEYAYDDITGHKIDISFNRQEIGTLTDTVKTLSQLFTGVKKKLDITADQSYLISGSISNINKDLQNIKQIQQNQQNQIDIISGSLASIIQEVQKVQLSFTTINSDIKDNKNFLLTNKKSLSDLNVNLAAYEKAFNDSINSTKTIIKKKNDSINLKLDEQKIETERNYKKLNSNLAEFFEEFENVKSKIIAINKELSDAELDIRSANKSINKVSDKVDQISNEIDKVSEKVDNIPSE